MHVLDMDTQPRIYGCTTDRRESPKSGQALLVILSPGGKWVTGLSTINQSHSYIPLSGSWSQLNLISQPFPLPIPNFVCMYQDRSVSQIYNNKEKLCHKCLIFTQQYYHEWPRHQYSKKRQLDKLDLFFPLDGSSVTIEILIWVTFEKLIALRTQLQSIEI